jgi:hypothetical protein
MSSNKKPTVEQVLKVLMRQLTGKLTESDSIVPQIIVKGEGNIWGWDPYNKKLICVERGTLGYILMEEYNLENKTLIYCTGGDIICIEPDEIELVGLN